MMKKKKALLIYNGNAGQKKIEKTLGAAVPILSQYVDELVIKPTKKETDAEEFCEQLDEDVNYLFILGGDGTVHSCINGVAGLHKKPAIGILPGGTCNDISRSLQIPQQIEQAAHALTGGELVSIDLLKTDQQYALNFWGIGLITEASENIRENEKAVIGKLSYFTSALRTLSRAEPFEVEMLIDGEKIIDKAVMLLVLNGHFIGTNRIPLANHMMNDGLADILICRNPSLSAFKELLALDDKSASEFDKDDLSFYQGKSIEITTKQEMKADTDGEIYTKTPVKIEVLKGHLQMIVPADSAIARPSSTD